MILSFHPCIEGDENIICAGRPPGDEEVAAIKKARAIILTQGVTERLYRLCRRYCPHVFPNYDARFDYPGKLGHIRLFQKNQVSCPPTVTFSDITAYQEALEKGSTGAIPFDFPRVMKFNTGGEGEGVFLLKNQKDLNAALNKVVQMEKSGHKGFLLQSYIPAKGKALRVVVIGGQCLSYWRIQEHAGVFQSNLRTGARIDHNLDPKLQARAVAATRNFCRQTGINLAGFDFLFQQDAKKPIPLFLEINYFFGRGGLGGSFRYYELLEKAIKEWLVKIGRDRSQGKKHP